jgi:type II secretory pathway component PulC
MTLLRFITLWKISDGWALGSSEPLFLLCIKSMNDMNDMKRRVLFSISVIGVVLLPLRALGEASPPSDLRLIGIGGILGTARVFAVIEERATGRQFIRATGDRVADAIILEIQGRKVLLQRGDRVVVWRVSQAISSTPDALGVTPFFRAELSQPHDPEEIRQLLYPSLQAQEGVVRYPVSQQTVQGLRADLARLYGAHQLTVVEHPVVGAGLQMEGAAAQAFRELGLQNGDLLLKANGLSLVNADQIPTLLDSLSRAQIINLQAVRGDDLISLHFTVQ